MIYEDKEVNLKHGEWLYHSHSGLRAFQFRYGPVINPYGFGTAKRDRGSRGKIWGNYRHPKTLHSLKMLEAGELDGFLRKKGGKSYLPTAYDDYCSHSEKNWKRFRKTQYKSI